MCNGLPGKKLPPEFYLQDTVQVARQLIGKLLVRRVEGQTLSAIICETEAYTGFSDKACHSYKGSSPRTRIMFEAGGRAYVYLIYGMYSCLNVTTREEGVPEAVLIRAASPVEGIERMMQLRQSKKPIKSLKENTLLSGPGRLCDALAWWWASAGWGGHWLPGSRLWGPGSRWLPGGMSSGLWPSPWGWALSGPTACPIGCAATTWW